MSCGCGSKCGPEFDPREEGLTEDDLERFGSYDHPCPCCGADIFHDAAVCPSCGNAIDTLASSGGKRMWIGAVALVVLVAFVMVIVL